MSDNDALAQVAAVPAVDVLAQASDQMLAAFRNGMELTKAGQLIEAIATLQSVSSLALQVRAEATEAGAMLQAMTEEDPRAAIIAEGIAFAAHGDVFAAAFCARLRGTQAVASAEFGGAVTFFAEAARLFEEFSAAEEAPFEWLANLSHAQSIHAEALKLTRDGNRGAGLDRLGDAIALMHSEILPRLSELDPADAGVVLILLAGLKLDGFLSQMLKEVLDEDFDAALSYAGSIHDDIVTLREDAQRAALAPEIYGQLDKRLVALMLAISGLEAFAMAGNARKKRSWDTFDPQLTIAKRRLADAQRASLEVKDSDVLSQQLTGLIEVLVEPARRRGQELRELSEQLEGYKESYRSLANKAGVQINASSRAETNVDVDARIKAELSVEIRTVVANFFEDRARDALAGLRATLGMVPADAPERAELLEKLDAFAAVPKDDPSWLDKAKSFTTDAAKIVGNIAKVAAPVVSAWNMFAPLFGAPPLPLPG